MTTEAATTPTAATTSAESPASANTPVPADSSSDNRIGATATDATAGEAPAGEAPAGDSALSFSREIDALSLRQALLDFEMANARVLDLTARLVEANARVIRLQKELDGFAAASGLNDADAAREIAALRASVQAIDAAKLNAEAAAAAGRAELAALRSSKTFRLARGLGRVASRLRR